MDNDSQPTLQQATVYSSLIVKLPDHEAYWEKHFSMNNWTLIHKHYELQGYRKRPYDGYVQDIYGWVEEITYGADKGKFKAGHPTYYDEVTDSDAVDLGLFNTLQEAKQAVLDNNAPSFGCYF